MATEKLDIGIVGASGYGGGELIRLLQRHPAARVKTAVSETYRGRPVSAAWPGLAGQSDLEFETYGDGAHVAQCDVVFLAMENGRAMETAPHLLEAGCKVVDLSADFRFRDTATYQRWYPATHTVPDVAARAVYGLPELYREAIRGAQLVGNPGCYPTASILALAPLFARGLADPRSIVIDAKSGVSGAGRSKFALDYHFPEVNESVSAYKAAGTHRHTAEIEGALGELAGSPFPVTFTPHLIPMTRGILATCYASLRAGTTEAELCDLYAEHYAGHPFVVVLRDALPATKHTLGSNRCHIGLALDTRMNRLTAVAAIDNLVKGMAGQAIQNMNLMCGFDETAGLAEIGGLWP
ncbi:MAG TPA: N-acetyl-gamma-glutamyl-phosphate reductase [Chthonomonadaceae bacterium]|nr:N-acetyl-gamma-glutamyl-phosphate reductase [Chthonomonadaceae bacterium]